MAGKRALVVNSSVLDVGGLLILYIMNDIRLVLKVRKKTREDGALTHLLNEIGEVWRRALKAFRVTGLSVQFVSCRLCTRAGPGNRNTMVPGNSTRPSPPTQTSLNYKAEKIMNTPINCNCLSNFRKCLQQHTSALF